MRDHTRDHTIAGSVFGTGSVLHNRRLSAAEDSALRKTQRVRGPHTVVSRNVSILLGSIT